MLQELTELIWFARWYVLKKWRSITGHGTVAYTIREPMWSGNSCGSREKAAVRNMADPTPSVILSRTQKVMNIQPEGTLGTNLPDRTNMTDGTHSVIM